MRGSAVSMNIQLARIDDRLIHGQVATSWSKQTDINRIIVVSNEVAQDQLRKFLLQEAAPPGVKVNVVPIGKMIEVYHNKLFEHEKVMLLFTNPIDVAALVEAGVPIKEVNIGGMSYHAGKKRITNFVSATKQELDAFDYLHDHGIEIEIRKVPPDRRVILADLLGKDRE